MLISPHATQLFYFLDVFLFFVTVLTTRLQHILPHLTTKQGNYLLLFSFLFSFLSIVQFYLVFDDNFRGFVLFCFILFAGESNDDGVESRIKSF